MKKNSTTRPPAAEVSALIVDLWSDLNPAAGYTAGHLEKINHLFLQSASNMQAMRARITRLRERLDEIDDSGLNATAAALLTSLETQLNMSRPSGAGPSGTGMGGVWAAADGVFYLVLKQDDQEAWVGNYLDDVLRQVRFETTRWNGQEFTIEVRLECLNTAAYLTGTLASLAKERTDLQDKIDAVNAALEKYKDLFQVPGLDSPNFNEYWTVMQEWDAQTGPTQTNGYPASLQNYYQLGHDEAEIEIMAQAWLDLDLPVTTQITEKIARLPWMKNEKSRNLQEIWDKVSAHYARDFTDDLMAHVAKVTDDYAKKYILSTTKEDKVLFDATPAYLENLVTGGEDFAVNYLDQRQVYSQLYLTKSKNSSMLTMINILVHEASHGYNFVQSAKNAGSPLLNLNTSLEVPITEGMAYYREWQYWGAAWDLLSLPKWNETQAAYMSLFGDNREEIAEGVLCSQLETYIWRIIRYVRALCDVKVNGGKMTYTDFIAWASDYTGLTQETLHGECFTFLSAPGYAPCYAVGGAYYGKYQKEGITHGVSEIDYNTYVSSMGFYTWPVAVAMMEAFSNPQN